MDFNQFWEIISAKNINIKELPNPKKSEKYMQDLTAFKPSKKFCLANCSETIQVHAIPKPEVVIVIKNI